MRNALHPNALQTPVAARAARAAPAAQPVPAFWPWQVAFALVLGLLDLVLIVAFRHLAAAVLPVPLLLVTLCVVGGSTSGLAALALWRLSLHGGRWAVAQTLAVLLCGVPPLVADGAFTHLALTTPSAVAFAPRGSNSVIPLLLFSIATMLIATILPLLLDEPRRALLGLPALFALCTVALATDRGDASPASAMATSLTASSPSALATLWTLLDREAGWLLCVAVVAALGLSWARAEIRSWRETRVVLWGAVLWSGVLRPVAILCAVVALVAALPVALPHVPGFEQAWSSLNPLRAGTFPSPQQGGAPMLEPGAPLPLSAGTPPDGETVLLRYSVQADTTGAPIVPPLLLATLDRFDGSAWASDPTMRTQAAPLPSTPLPATGTVIADITVVTPLLGNYLAGPDTPIAYRDVPGGVEAEVSTPGGALSIDGWQTGAALRPGVSYTVSSVVLSPRDTAEADAVDPASVPADLLAIPSDMPSDLRSLMLHDAMAWTAEAATPAAKAQALASALRAHFRLDAHDPAPAGPWAALQRFFATGQGNALAWTTAHALLCRLAGVPVRLVEGFAPGEMDLTTGARLERARDFTLYVQVATAAGWARIGVLDDVQSVTQAVPALTPPPGAYGQPTPTPSPPAARSSSPPSRMHPLQIPHAPRAAARALLVLLAVLLCCMVVALLLVAQGRRRGRRRRLEWRAAHLLASLVRPAVRAGVPLTPGETALGLAAQLVALLDSSGVEGHVALPLYELAVAYTQRVYQATAPSGDGHSSGDARFRDGVPLDMALLARAEAATGVVRSILRTRSRARARARARSHASFSHSHPSSRSLPTLHSSR